MPSFSLAISRMRRLVADWEISMSDFGDWCCEAGMGAVHQMKGKREMGRREQKTRSGYVNLALTARLADLAHSPASIFLPSAGCTRVTLKRPSAQTTVKPSASTAAISPVLPAMPLGSFAGKGLA